MKALHDAVNLKAEIRITGIFGDFNDNYYEIKRRVDELVKPLGWEVVYLSEGTKCIMAKLTTIAYVVKLPNLEKAE